MVPIIRYRPLAAGEEQRWANDSYSETLWGQRCSLPAASSLSQEEITLVSGQQKQGSVGSCPLAPQSASNTWPAQPAWASCLARHPQTKVCPQSAGEYSLRPRLVATC